MTNAKSILQRTLCLSKNVILGVVAVLALILAAAYFTMRASLPKLDGER